MASATRTGKPLAPDFPIGSAAIKARWICEQGHQQLKEELGLDHFDGRSWTGPPPTRADDDDRPRLPAIPPPQAGQRGKKNPRPTAATKPARDPAGHPLSPRTAAVRSLSPLSQILINRKSAKVVLVPDRESRIVVRK
jgi:hypothetical protein